MRAQALNAFLFLAMTASGISEAAEPTLESLESLGEGVEANAQGKNNLNQQIETVKVEGANAQAQDAVDASANTETKPPVVNQADFMRPASDMSGAQAIDIQNQMKKITEPNLFAGAAPNPGTLRNLASGEAPEEYLVQEGDTLFDICDQLVDEPDYWPKLWAFNPTIENPHFVYPGMRLRFYPGDDKSPPFLQVITEDDILPVAKGAINEAELVREDISGMLMKSEIPDPTKILDPKDLDAIVRLDNLFIMSGGTYSSATIPLILPGFVVADELSKLGEVIGGSAGSQLADKDQQIVMEKDLGLEVGTTYSVVRRGPKVKNSEGDTIGYRYDFVAQIRVTDQDKSDTDAYRGDVLFNRIGVEPGDLVVPYRSVRRAVPSRVVPDAKGIQQEVVNFTESWMEIGGKGTFVFLDQSKAKLEEKKTYKILQDIRVAAPESMKKKLPSSDNKVANVYILDASGSAALGMITNDSLEVRLGDRISP